jgi:hypothetical protein
MSFLARAKSEYHTFGYRMKVLGAMITASSTLINYLVFHKSDVCMAW